MAEPPLPRPGRNDPCHCGSGKKFKHCHGAAAAIPVEPLYERMRAYDGESEYRLLKFARERYGDRMLERAWEEFHFSDGTPFDMSGPGADPFTRWFLFTRPTESGTTIAGEFLDDRGIRIDSGLREFIEATVRSPYSFLQVTGVESGSGLVLHDILRKRDVHVTERVATEYVKPGDILLARAVEHGGISFLMGVGKLLIMPHHLITVVRLRESLEKKEGAGGPISDTALLHHEPKLRKTYFELVELMTRPPDLRNTDGDPLSFHTLTYEVPSFEEAFDALKDLEQRVTGESDERMLGNAECTPGGKPFGLTLHWLKKGTGRLPGDRTLLAVLSIRRSKLTVEVNSERRAKRIRKEIEKRLGDRALLVKTEIRSQEALMKGRSTAPRRSRKDEELDRNFRNSPEVMAQVKSMMDEHWARWLDKPLPALRGMSPRQAVKDPVGKELLESLLMSFEARNQEEGNDLGRPDVGRIRRELGIGGS